MAVKAKGKASRVAVWAILGLLIVGLAGFGATNFGGSVRSIGKVGDTDIGLTRYGRALNQELRALQAQTGQQISFQQAQLFGIDRAVLARLIDAVALEEEARRAGLSVGDARVGEYVREVPAFQGLDGNFDREGYAFALEQSGLSAAEFEEDLRAELARSLVAGAVSAGAVAPATYIDAIVTFVAEGRDASWARLGPADLAEPVGAPTEADLQAHYEANPEAFTLPETRTISYAWVTPDIMVDQIEVPEDELRELYQDRIEVYVQPERRLVERLVYPNAGEAEAAKARLDAGEITFDALVEARGLSLQDIDLGDVTEADLGSAGAAVFAMDGPGVVGPVQTSLGPALIRMNAVLSAQETPFEDAREELQRLSAMDRAARMIADEIETVDDLLAAGATLEELAEETALEFGQVEWSTGVSDGIAGYAAFRAAAARAEPGDFPEVLELEDGGIFALRIDEIRAPELLPLDAVRPEVENGWRREAVAEALMAQARALADEIAAGTADFAALEVETGTEAGLTRETILPDLPPTMVETLFSMDTGALEVVADGDGAMILRLDTVTAPDFADPDLAQRREAFRQRIAQSIGQDMLDAYTRAIEATAGIELDQAAINAVHATLQ